MLETRRKQQEIELESYLLGLVLSSSDDGEVCKIKNYLINFKKNRTKQIEHAK